MNRSIAEGRELGIQGTPTLFINGRKIGGLMWPDLQLVINKGAGVVSQATPQRVDEVTWRSGAGMSAST